MTAQGPQPRESWGQRTEGQGEGHGEGGGGEDVGGEGEGGRLLWKGLGHLAQG